jgi:hypothetical protein
VVVGHYDRYLELLECGAAAKLKETPLPHQKLRYLHLGIASHGEAVKLSTLEAV